MSESAGHKGVLVIGGGIAGITAALDLADKGLSVFLVEKSPSIGGHMAQLDKTYPTLDCSICILAPKMVEAARHPRIRLMTCSEVDTVDKVSDGSFKVAILKNSRFVDESLCKGCGICSEKCPTKVANEFEGGLGTRKAIYIPFPQAVPAVAAIDKDHCLYLTKGVCRICEKVCPAGAIDYEQKPHKIIVNVSSIIAATGHALLDVSVFSQYGLGKHPDVLTSMQYERTMNAAGPTGGKIVKPSDGTKPNRIVFIQCVGSRSEKPGRMPYCSQVCCMYATKQAIVTREHEHDIDVKILYNDLRAAGKGYEALVERAKDEFRVDYIKGLPGEIVADITTGKPMIRYVDVASGEMKELGADIVVLCPAVVPQEGAGALAGVLGVKTDEYGFFESPDPLYDVRASVPGIFVCGSSQGPKDISHSVIQAHAAAAEAVLRAMPVEIPEAPKETASISEELLNVEPRVGVFVCHCGLNIANVVDMDRVIAHTKTMPGVAYAEDLLYTCSKDGTEKIKETIKAHGLNRVVVAACTPSTHAPLFKSICKEAGLNPYLFEMVNLREHASWVHNQYPEEATEKAVDLVEMAVAKAALLQPLKEFTTDITPSALVVGGSVAGLIASKVIADAGFKVLLVEESEKLGGQSIEEYPLVPLSEVNVSKDLKDLVKAVEKHQNVQVILSSKPTSFKGSIGSFDVSIEESSGKNRKERVGVAVLAPDAHQLELSSVYSYGKEQSVYSIAEFSQMLKGESVTEGERIGFIIHGGLESCYAETLDLALQTKKAEPSAKILVFYQDIRLPLEGEKFYRRAREEGIMFIRYEEGSKPSIHVEAGTPVVEVKDVTLGQKFSFPMEKTVVALPIVAPEQNEKLSSTFKVPLNQEGFFLEVHPKMRPIDFASDGLFVAGSAHSPQSLNDAVTQGLAAASRALLPLMLHSLTVEPLIAVVEEDKCTGCGTCVSICEYNAPKMAQSTQGRLVAEIDPMLCKGCGTCVARCPGRAIETNGFTRAQTIATIKAALAKISQDKPKAVAFLCNWCAYAGANMAGVSRFQYPPAVRIIRMMCSGMVDPFYVLYSFLQGADGVIIGGCKKNDCHYIFGNTFAGETVESLRGMLKTTLIEPDRLLDMWISAGEGRIFADKVAEFTKKLESLGPTPYKKR